MNRRRTLASAMDLAEVERLLIDRPALLLPPRLTAVDPGRLVDVVPLHAGAWLAIVEAGDGLIVVPLVDGADGPRRATPGDGAWEALLGVIAGGGNDDLRVRVDREVPAARGEREIDVDQSNESVIVGDAAVVKLFVRSAAGPQPAMDVPAHLAAVGFTRMPASFGAVTWVRGDAEVLIATAVAYLPGATDGWEWYPSMVEEALDGDASFEPAIDAAARIGEVVGSLHAALATPSAVWPQPLGSADAGTWHAGARQTLDDALALTDGVEGGRLRSLAPVAADALDVLTEVGPTPVMRIHGDLHVGQILRWDEGFAVSDFDGNPLSPMAGRIAPDSPARDVAAMVRAIDHVGWVVQRRRPGCDDDVRAWVADARGAFLQAYRANTPGGLFDERLLAAFEVAQEAHEYVYAARYLPRWRPIPDLAMPGLLAAIT